MKGKIIRHEWERFAIRTKKCVHCKCIKTVYAGEATYYVNSISQSEEPKCITRKKPENGTDSAT
jgi:hypothetical protein